jgi:predicted MFS family arabinose efflux permease
MSDRRRLQLLFALAALAHTTLLASRVAVPIAALDSGATPFAVGALMAVFSLLPGAIGVQTGRWIDRVGVRVPMVACKLLFAGAFLAAAWRPALWMLFLANAALGLSISTFQVANTSAVGAIGRPEDRTSNYAWMSLTGALASMLGPLLGGSLVDHLGIRGAFAALALLPFAGLLLLVLGRRFVPALPKARAGPAPRGPVLELALHPKRLGVLVIGSAFGIAWDVYSFVVPVHGRSLGLSGTEIGSLISAFGIAMVIVRGAMPVLVRAFRDWSITIVALVTCTTVFALFPFFHSLAVLYSLSFVYGLAHGAVQPVLNSLIYAASPQGRVNELLGLRSAVHNIVHTVAPLALGLVGSAFGMTPVFLAGAVALGAGSWLTVTRWSRS